MPSSWLMRTLAPTADLMLLLLLLLFQFGLLAQLPVLLASVGEHEVLKTAAQALISVFPAAQYVRCVHRGP